MNAAVVSSALPATLSELLREARRRLSDAGVQDAALDARLLVEHVSGTTRADAISNPTMVIDPETLKAVEAVLERRVAGEPVHRILGFREFYGLRLRLSKETLEPRPDTETLVEVVLPFVRRAADARGTCRLLDLGTGTGAIALALVSAEPRAAATAVEISEDALATAARNAADLGLADRFSPLISDWFEKVSGRYDVIVSNPPYIPAKDIATLQKEVREFDPRRALDGGNDGLDAYRIIAAGAASHLERGGIVAVEIGHTQKDDVSALFAEAGFVRLEAVRDLAGNDRGLVFALR
jgi:release factor glutamine methyltransferase